MKGPLRICGAYLLGVAFSASSPTDLGDAAIHALFFAPWLMLLIERQLHNP